MAMARSALLFALFLLPALALAHLPMRRSLVVHGKVVCDTCLADFETSASTPIPGAEVEIVCKDRLTSVITYTQKAVTDSSGCYKMYVDTDQGSDVCNVVAAESLKGNCPVQVRGRESARVILTRNNGMTSDERFANSLLFKKLRPDAGCAKVMEQYKETEDQY